MVGLSTVIAWQPGQAQQSYDVLIRGGRVIDGTGAQATTNVGVSGGRIAAVGALTGATAKAIVAARGQAVSGFIDVHTHAEEIGEHPFAVHFVRMGVTTVVADKGLVEGAMTGGAVGFSTGLQYVPGTYGDASDDRRRPDEGDAGRS